MKLTWSTWMACILSGLVPCTRNKATRFSLYVSSTIPFSSTNFLYPELFPPYKRKKWRIWSSWLCDFFFNIKHNLKMRFYWEHTFNMINLWSIEKKWEGSLPSWIWAWTDIRCTLNILGIVMCRKLICLLYECTQDAKCSNGKLTPVER